MSHAPERAEKDCLNCGTVVQGRYCHVCGQENIVPKESFWSLVLHFFYDITHFDSKFFGSIHHLFLKPGYLSAEFMRGKRASYLNPVRMYVFTSAFFFVVFFTLFKSDEAVRFSGDSILTNIQRDSAMVQLREELQKNPENKYINHQLELLADTSKPLTMLSLLESGEDYSIVSVGDRKFRTVEEYDSVQSALPVKQRDGWFVRQLMHKQIDLNSKYRGRTKEASNKLVEIILHKLPYLLIVSLPLFALVLKLLYIRRKKFYYADHAIFSIHHYIFSFLVLLLILIFNKLEQMTGAGIFTFVNLALTLLLLVYLYKAMRNFYQQGWFKTLFKYFILLNLATLINLVLLVLFFVFSIFSL